jgi:hypothetical protein
MLSTVLVGYLVCRDCCQNMLSRATVGYMPWLLPKHTVKSRDWIYAMTVAKTCCQDPWLGNEAYVVTVANTCCQEPRLGICHDCCQNMLSRATIGYMPWLLAKHTVKSRGWEYAVIVVKTCCQQPWLSNEHMPCRDCCQNMLYALTVAKTSCQQFCRGRLNMSVAKTCYQQPWLGICRDCCQNMLYRAMVGHMPWLLPTHAVKSHGWTYAVTFVKTCCQEPWFVIAMTVAKTCYLEPWVGYNGHDYCQNMLSTSIVEYLGHDSGLGWVDGPCLLPNHAVNSHGWVS